MGPATQERRRDVALEVAQAIGELSAAGLAVVRAVPAPAVLAAPGAGAAGVAGATGVAGGAGVLSGAGVAGGAGGRDGGVGEWLVREAIAADLRARRRR